MAINGKMHSIVIQTLIVIVTVIVIVIDNNSQMRISPNDNNNNNNNNNRYTIAVRNSQLHHSYSDSYRSVMVMVLVMEGMAMVCLSSIITGGRK